MRVCKPANARASGRRFDRSHEANEPLEERRWRVRVQQTLQYDDRRADERFAVAGDEANENAKTRVRRRLNVECATTDRIDRFLGDTRAHLNVCGELAYDKLNVRFGDEACENLQL